MTTPSSPTARARELGRRLKELRESRGKTLADIADELSCSQAKISRMETGQRPVQPLDLKVLCRFYDLPPTTQRELTALATESRKRGWWHEVGYLDEEGRTYLGLEAAASRIRILEVLRAPGLLQTSEYAKTWVTRIRPRGYWSDAMLTQLVDTRARRQQRVKDGSLSLEVLIDERAFLSGSSPFSLILLHQVEQLISYARQDNVDLRVIPLTAGPHAGLDGSFHLMSFEEIGLDDMVFVEGQYGNAVLDRTEVVTRYTEVYGSVHALSMSPQESLEWLHERHSTLSESVAEEQQIV